MITLSASSGHILLMHFQRQGFSKCKFYGSHFKHRYFRDVLGRVSSLDMFWQVGGEIAGGDLRFALVYFGIQNFFFLNACVNTIMWTLNLI